MVDKSISSTNILRRLRILLYCDPNDLPLDWYIHYRLLKKNLAGEIGVDVFYLGQYTTNAYSRSIIEPIGNFAGQPHGQLAVVTKTHNIDIVYDPQKSIASKHSKANVHQPFIICVDQNALSAYIDAFLAGKGIVWCFNNPHLQLAWIYKYTHTNYGLTYQAHGIYGKLPRNKRNLTNATRNLVGKCMQVEYTRDMLAYSLLKINYERRNWSSEITRSEFEFGVHLTSYYSLMSSIFEILATLLCLRYGIPRTENKTIDITNKDFRQEIKEHNPALWHLYKKTSNRSWVSWINQVRNYLAHSGYAYISNLIQEPEGGIDNAMVDLEARQVIQSVFGKQKDSGLDEDTYACILGTMKDKIYIEKHNVIATDTMLIEYSQGKKLFRPFFHFDKDYSKLHGLIKLTRELL